MQVRIQRFYKTQHFLYRQWDRSVSDDLLRAVLGSLSKEHDNLLVVVSRNYLKRKGVKCKCELFIKINGNA